MPSSRIKLTVKVEGYRELMAKLKAETTLAGPWKSAMQQGGEIMLAAGQGAAPTGESGQLRAKLMMKMSAAPVPKYALVKTTATRSSAKFKRYPYPKRLEYDPESSHRLWLTNAVNAAWGRIRAALDGAARAIESKWGG